MTRIFQKQTIEREKTMQLSWKNWFILLVYFYLSVKQQAGDLKMTQARECSPSSKKILHRFVNFLIGYFVYFILALLNPWKIVFSWFTISCSLLNLLLFDTVYYFPYLKKKENLIIFLIQKSQPIWLSELICQYKKILPEPNRPFFCKVASKWYIGRLNNIWIILVIISFRLFVTFTAILFHHGVPTPHLLHVFLCLPDHW